MNKYDVAAAAAARNTKYNQRDNNIIRSSNLPARFIDMKMSSFVEEEK